jgi:hypothetical protein
MADQPIKGSEIIEDGLFVDAIKQADLLIHKLKDLETQQVANLTASKEYINSFKVDGSKSLKDLNTETIKVNATLKEYEVTQLGIADIAKKQAQLKSELAKQTREELKLTKELAKADAEKLKITVAQNGEYSKASKELAKLKRELQDLNIAGKTNTKEFKDLNKQFEDLDSRVRKADASVGNFQRNVGNYPAQLKAMQRELQGLEPGSKAFNDLAEKAGKLKDAIGDAKDATKAFATESKATTAKTLFGQIGNDIADLDFKGAAEKAGQFASVMRSISFAEVIAGIKSFATSIIVAGEAILASPIGLFVLTITALVGAFKMYKDTVNMVYEAQSDLNSQLRESNLLMQQGRTEYLKSANQTLLLQGKISSKEKQISDLVLDSKLKLSESNAKYQDDVKKLLADEEINEFQRKKKLYKLTYDYAIAGFNLERKAKQDIKNIKLEADNKEIEAEKDKQKKLSEARGKIGGGLSEKLDNKDVSIIEEIDKEYELKKSAIDKNTAGLVDDMNANNKKLADAKKAKQDEELKKELEFGKQMLDAISKAEADKSAAKLASYDKELKDADKNIDMQRQLAIRGSKNTLAEAEADKIRIERQKEEEKQKEIKRQKALAFFKLFASYAEKDPNTALTKALRDTVLAEAVAGAFFKGTENVERDLQDNKVHNGIDGYQIRVHGKERVMTEDQNAKVGALSNEALADLAYKHNNGLLDTAKYGVIQSSDFATNMTNSALLMETMALRKEMQEVKEAIKNKAVTSFEFGQYGDFIKTTIENGFTKKTTYKNQKPRI